MLPSSKSPSTVPGRRAVPFLAASRSISAWGETTASGPSAPRPAPGSGDPWLKSQSPAPPAILGLPPRPRSPGLRPLVCRSGWQAWTLLAVARPRLPHASSANDASRCGGGEGPGPQESSRKPAGSAGPSTTNASPSPPGARVSAAAHPGQLPAARSSAQCWLQPISPPVRLPAPTSDCHTCPKPTFLLEHSREAVSTGFNNQAL